jgi:hypothetical protein
MSKRHRSLMRAGQFAAGPLGGGLAPESYTSGFGKERLKPTPHLPKLRKLMLLEVV